MDKLQQKLEEILAKQREILDTADADNDGLMTDEQRTEFDALEEQKTDVNAKIEQAKADAERRKALEAAERSVTAGAGRQTRPSQPANPNVRVTESQEEKWLEDPKGGFEKPRDFLMAVLSSEKGRRITDDRLKVRIGAGGIDFYATAGSDEAGAYSDPYGGFLLPSGFSPELLMLDNESDPTMGRTRSIPMTTQTISIPARVDKTHTSSVSGGLIVYRNNETDTVSSTRMQFEQIELRPTKLTGVSYATEEILELSPISFVSILEQGFSDEFNTKILKEKLFGTGAGQYTGVVNADCTVSVAKETGQEAATILKENIDKMRARCWRYGRSIWLYNHDCLPQLLSLVQTVGTGGAPVPYFQTDVNGNATLAGRPAFASEFCETVGTVGDIILGNWGEYLEGTLMGMRSAESVHVRFLNHERTFKFWMSNDGKPWWSSALTPNQSSDTLSPFVTLAARA